MGNKASGQTFPTDAVIAECVRACNVFGPLFVKAYSIALVRKLQREHDLEHDGAERVMNKEGYRLERPPTATEPMEKAYVTKLGEIKKNWKRRFFVATEEADNFVVYYFEREADASNPAKAKGCIHPCGYIVRSATPEVDGKDIGDTALCLEPLDRKRTWYLRFDSADERAAWKQVLQYTALHCQAPLSSDPALAEAFKQAFARSRRQLGLHGYYVLDRSEQEQLGVLAAQACESNVLRSIYDSLSAMAAMGAPAPGAATTPAAGSTPVGSPGGAPASGAAAGSKAAAEADKTRASVDKELERIVGEVVASAWPAISARVELRRDAVSRIAAASLGNIVREEELRKAEIRERTAKDVRNIARDVAGPIVSTVLGALLKPLYKAHKEAVKMFWNKLHAIVDNGLKEGELRSFYRDVRWQHVSLGPAFRKIRALTRGEVDETDAGDAALKLLSDLTVPLPELVSLMQGVTLWEVETMFEEHLRQLVGWGIYSFVAAVERSRGGLTPIACLHAIMRNMIYDSKIRQRENLTRIFRMVLCPLLRQQAAVHPAVRSILDHSVAWSAPGFSVFPGGGTAAATGASATPAAAPAPASGAAAKVVPTATPVRVNKKSKATAESEVTSSPLAEVFLDADWMMDDVLEEVLDSVVSGITEARVAPMLARLDKLPGKLGFSSA